MTQGWVKLQDAKNYLEFESGNTDADLTLQRMADAAAAMIEDIKGHVETGPVVAERHRVTNNLGAVFLNERPVAHVDAVRVYRSDGTTVDVPLVDAADPTTATGYDLAGEVASGVIQLPIFGPYASPTGAAVSVDYTYGLDPIPANYVEAALELVAHLWRTSQEQALGGRTNDTDTDWMRGASGSASYALPFRVRELLGIYGNVVKSSGVRVL